jgi:hypothetical protein
MALGELTKPAYYDAAEIHIYADCIPALCTVFDPGVRSASGARLIACQLARPWFKTQQDHVLHLHYVPSHRGILINELVDDDAQRHASGNNFQPKLTSVSAARQTAALKAGRDWTNDARRPDVRGSQFLLTGRHLPKPATARGGGLFTHVFGTWNAMAARAARAITNHAPTGEYRRRFFPNKRRDCPECGVKQTWRHILNVCTWYKRRQINCLAFLKNSSNPDAPFLNFFTDNPSAFSFADAPPMDN